MKTLFATLLAVVLCFSSPQAWPTEQSILPLKSDGHAFCTAFSINAKEKLWATARHCAAFAQQHDLDVTIDGYWALPIYVSPDNDLAVFQSGAKGVPLTLSAYAPEVGDKVLVSGYPWGLPVLVETRGTVAVRFIVVMGSGASDILDIAVAPGNSGSPVLNSQGQVIGVLWGMSDKGGHAFSITWETVRRQLGPFFQKVA